MENKNRFDLLNSLDVNEHLEKKGNLKYLSWSWAWAELKKRFPNSYYTIYENKDGWNYFTDGRTCWVKTGVTLVDGDFSLEHIEYLPIMDFKNQSVTVDAVNSMNVNKTIQRSLTKACARHGIGLYVYAGEDLPEESEDDKRARIETERMINELIEKVDSEFTRLTKNLSKDGKVAFLDSVIVPTLGVRNYKTCRDLEKLKLLASMLSGMKAEKAAA